MRGVRAAFWRTPRTQRAPHLEHRGGAAATRTPAAAVRTGPCERWVVLARGWRHAVAAAAATAHTDGRLSVALRAYVRAAHRG